MRLGGLEGRRPAGKFSALMRGRREGSGPSSGPEPSSDMLDTKSPTDRDPSHVVDWWIRGIGCQLCPDVTELRGTFSSEGPHLCLPVFTDKCEAVLSITLLDSPPSLKHSPVSTHPF